MSVILNMPAGFINHVDIHFMPLYFLKIDAESLFLDVVPLGHFRRVADSQADAIIFFRNSHRRLDFRRRAIKSFSQSDVFERGVTLTFFAVKAIFRVVTLYMSLLGG